MSPTVRTFALAGLYVLGSVLVFWLVATVATPAVSEDADPDGQLFAFVEEGLLPTVLAVAAYWSLCVLHVRYRHSSRTSNASQP